MEDILLFPLQPASTLVTNNTLDSLHVKQSKRTWQDVRELWKKNAMIVHENVALFMKHLGGTRGFGGSGFRAKEILLHVYDNLRVWWTDD